jgi:hypothetical protein
LTFSRKVPLRFVTNLPKVAKIAKKILLDPVSASSLVTTFWIMHYVRVKIFFSQYVLLHRYQKIQNFTQISKLKTYLGDKMHLKKQFKKKEFLYYTGGTLCTGGTLYPGISLLGAFCHKGKFIFLKPT